MDEPQANTGRYDYLREKKQSTDAMMTTMKQLKLFGMAHSIGELSEQNSQAYTQAILLLEQLLKTEVAERELHSIQYQMKMRTSQPTVI